MENAKQFVWLVVALMIIFLGTRILVGLDEMNHPRVMTPAEVAAHPDEQPSRSKFDRFCAGLLGPPIWEVNRDYRIKREEKYRESPDEITVHVNAWSGESPEIEALKEWPGFGTVKSVAQATGKGRYSVVLSKNPEWATKEIAQVNR